MIFQFFITSNSSMRLCTPVLQKCFGVVIENIMNPSWIYLGVVLASNWGRAGKAQIKPKYTPNRIKVNIVRRRRRNKYGTFQTFPFTTPLNDFDNFEPFL